MKITAGKYYRTRSGEKVYILGIAPSEVFAGHTDLLAGFLNNQFTTWFPTGNYGNWENGLDLISEWQDQTTETVKLPEKLSPRCGAIGATFDIGSSEYAINQLIDYISSLEQRVAALEPDNRKQIQDM